MGNSPLSGRRTAGTSRSGPSTAVEECHLARLGELLVQLARQARQPDAPLVALSSGRRVDGPLAEHLSSTLIEHLPRRFFCVSANLTWA
jgi:hypothetical protein